MSSRRVEAENDLYRTRVRAFKDVLCDLEKYYSQRVVAEALNLEMPPPTHLMRQILSSNKVKTTKDLEDLILRIKIECI